MMKLFNILGRSSPNTVTISLVCGLLAGLFYSMLIPLVLTALKEPTNVLLTPVNRDEYYFMFFEISQHKFALSFFVVCLCVLVFRSLSQIMLARVSMTATANLRKTFYERVSLLPIEQLERIGASRIMATITSDVPRIVQGASAIPDILISSLTVIGLLGFLLYLNVDVFYFIVSAILFGIVTYQIPLKIGSKYYAKSRPYVDSLHESIKGLIFGAKELKLSTKKREHFFKDTLHFNEDAILHGEKTGYSVMQVANNYGDMISFFVIGMVAFIVVNYQDISRDGLTGIVMALLYLTGPIAGILNSVPSLAIGKVSLNRYDDLLSEMTIEHTQTCQSLNVPQWSEIRTNALKYQYTAKNGNTDEQFIVGPIDLSIRKGEVTFIVGGNGSGKSTLGKLLSSHYLPTGGHIAFDDVVINKENRDLYRQQISAIYSDYYLFDKVLGTEGGELDNTIIPYLESLGLRDKVKVVNGHFSTTSLSDGQRRRLALIVSLLEKRNFYLFDEWAADQDPVFKKTFYENILAMLKADGKAVVVISHDDRYFGMADRIITMESGRIIKDEYISPENTTSNYIHPRVSA